MTNTIKVISLDPGITTGYTTGLIEDGRMGVLGGQAKWTEFELYSQLKQSHPNVIVYETFEYRNSPKARKDRVELYSRNLIGVVNMYVQERAFNKDSCGLYTQTPSQGLSGMFTDTKLKKTNVYKTACPHANDAMRHILYWFTFGAGFRYNTVKSKTVDNYYSLA